MSFDYKYYEMCLLSILLFADIKKDTIFYTFSKVKDEMFRDDSSRHVYMALQAMVSTEDISLLGTKHFAPRIGYYMPEIDSFDLKQLLIEIESHVAVSATLNYFIKKVQQNYFSIKYQEATTKKEFQEIMQLENEVALESGLMNIADDAEAVIDEYEKKKETAIFTGYPSIDHQVGSLQGGDVVILAGATGGGKTCLMLNLIANMAKRKNKVDIFSLEMPRSQLQARMICAGAKIDAHKLRAFTMTEEDKHKYKEYAQKEFASLPIKIYGQQVVTLDRIRAIEEKSDSDIVFIDYLGLIKPTTKGASKYQIMSDISRDLKILAMELNKPIVALHQLSRAFMDREDKRPRTSDLRDSGQIEQDADFIWFILRPKQFDPNARPEEMIFINAKNRFGEANTEIKLLYNGRHQQILEPLRL